MERGRVSEGGPDGTDGRVDEGKRRDGERERGGRDGGSEVAQLI